MHLQKVAMAFYIMNHSLLSSFNFEVQMFTWRSQSLTSELDEQRGLSKCLKSEENRCQSGSLQIKITLQLLKTKHSRYNSHINYIESNSLCFVLPEEQLTTNFGKSGCRLEVHSRGEFLIGEIYHQSLVNKAYNVTKCNS